ncbi:MAG: hypothetical protein IPK16_32660 [Anaerolineales bacterium]|nr:hypothetical protein [Anaerolineales bacterium]
MHPSSRRHRWIPLFAIALPLMLGLSLALLLTQAASATPAPQDREPVTPHHIDANVPVGAGSYTDQLPAGRQGPSVLACSYQITTTPIIVEPTRPATPTTASGFQGPVQTNDWWSSIVWKANNNYNPATKACDLNRWSEGLFPHPWALNIQSNPPGNVDTTQMRMGYSNYFNIPDDIYQGTYRTYQRPFLPNFTLSFKDAGGNYIYAEDTKLVRYSDWDVTALSDDGQGHSWETTMLHGSPYVFIQTDNIERIELRLQGISTATFPSLQPVPGVAGFTQYFQSDPNTGMTPNPVTQHFGFFTTGGGRVNNDSGDWRVFSVQGLPASGYVAIALLPDLDPTTLEFYRQRAYALPVNTQVDWRYDPAASQVTTDFNVTTQLVDNAAGNLNETLQSLYRHQWLNLSAPSMASLTPFTYSSVAGEMKVVNSNRFSTTLTYHGIVNALPSVAGGDPVYSATLESYLASASTATPAIDSYFNGKDMARLAELARIAGTANLPVLRTKFITALKPVLEDWLTYSGPSDDRLLYRDDTWGTMIPYPTGYDADLLLNDHHFHFGYWIMAAAALADADPNWGASDQYGGMVELLIKDVANWDRSDPTFPFLRFFDPYAGHSWANGAANAGAGNNQESSSEAINFAVGLIQWGEVTGNDTIRDLGVYLYTTETNAVQQYWFDVDEAIIPHTETADGRTYPWKFTTIVWGNMGNTKTYFGASAACSAGINVLPVTGGSLYLGQDRDHVKTIYDQVAATYDAFICWQPAANTANPQPPVTGGDNWAPFFWQYLAFNDPVSAAGMFTDTIPYLNNVDSGTSPAQVYYWLENMKALGSQATWIVADDPLAAAFVRYNGGLLTAAAPAFVWTYVVHNHDDQEKIVTFSNGVQVTAPANDTTIVTDVHGNIRFLPMISR